MSVNDDTVRGSNAPKLSAREKNPEAKRHCRDHNRDEETNAFEEGAFNNPNREASYAARA